jgi:hypothetical protein
MALRQNTISRGDIAKRFAASVLVVRSAKTSNRQWMNSSAEGGLRRRALQGDTREHLVEIGVMQSSRRCSQSFSQLRERGYSRNIAAYSGQPSSLRFDAWIEGLKREGNEKAKVDIWF